MEVGSWAETHEARELAGGGGGVGRGSGSDSCRSDGQERIGKSGYHRGVVGARRLGAAEARIGIQPKSWRPFRRFGGAGADRLGYSSGVGRRARQKQRW